MKILVAIRSTSRGWRGFAARARGGRGSWGRARGASPGGAPYECSSASSTKITKVVVDAAKALKVVVRAGRSRQLDAARSRGARGVKVLNTPEAAEFGRGAGDRADVHAGAADRAAQCRCGRGWEKKALTGTRWRGGRGRSGGGADRERGGVSARALGVGDRVRPVQDGAAGTRATGSRGSAQSDCLSVHGRSRWRRHISARAAFAKSARA